MSENRPQRIIVGISGASGAEYARRCIELMLAAGIETHLVVSPLGRRLLHDELRLEGLDLAALAGGEAGGPRPEGLVLHPYRDVGAAIASGSFLCDGMAILPCSSNSLAAVASGSSQNLMHRAAHVTLKERRRLILLHREAPVGLVDIRNMAAATEAGAIVCPASPGFYLLPRSLEDLIDFMAARVLDLLEVPHELNARWGDSNMDEGDF